MVESAIADGDLAPPSVSLAVVDDDFRPPTPLKDDAMARSSRDEELVAVLSPPAPPPKDVPPKDLPPRPFRSPRPESSSTSSSDDEVGDTTRTEIHSIFEQSSAPSRTSPLDGADAPSEKQPAATPPETDTHTPSHVPAHVPPRTRPAPDEDLPFDFHRFLSQLRHRSADPVARFLRSFLSEFAKKQWMVHEQIKIVSDFLNFIYGKMEQCEVWLNVGEVEMDNAREGMEKLVMNRLYTQTFSPEIPFAQPTGGGSGKSRRHRREREERFPGRRGQHQEDTERDEVLAQKVRIYGWIREEHLDIQDTVTEGRRKFLDLAVNEMVKIGSYRAPRDKVICVLNCCKVIFGLLRHSGGDESADKFVPLLIYVVLRANPESLVSNVQYILRFRNPDKLNGEAGYYLSSLMGAIQFIEGLDRSSLTITDEEFERNVEAAVAEIAERPPPPPPPPLPPRSSSLAANNEKLPQIGIPTATPRSSSERDPRTSTSSRESADSTAITPDTDEKLAVAGLLRTIQRPLTTIGRMFTDDPSSPAAASGPARTPAPGNTPRGSPTAEEAAARQASAEAEEARKIERRGRENVLATLSAMFPDLDREVIGDVVRAKEGSIGSAVDACLALSAG